MICRCHLTPCLCQCQGVATTIFRRGKGRRRSKVTAVCGALLPLGLSCLLACGKAGRQRLGSDELGEGGEEVRICHLDYMYLSLILIFIRLFRFMCWPRACTVHVILDLRRVNPSCRQRSVMRRRGLRNKPLVVPLPAPPRRQCLRERVVVPVQCVRLLWCFD